MESILRSVLESVRGGRGGSTPTRPPAKLVPFPTELLDWSESFASERTARRDHDVVTHPKIESVPVLLNQIILLSSPTPSG